MKKVKVGEYVEKDGRTYKVIDVVASGPVLTLVQNVPVENKEAVEEKEEVKAEAPKRGRKPKE